MDVVRALFAAVRDRDGYAVAELCAEDAEFVVLGVTVRGALEIRDCFLDLFTSRLPGWRLEPPVLTGTESLTVRSVLNGPRRRLPVLLEFEVRGDEVVRMVAVATGPATARP